MAYLWLASAFSIPTTSVTWLVLLFRPQSIKTTAPKREKSTLSEHVLSSNSKKLKNPNLTANNSSIANNYFRRNEKTAFR